MWFFGVRMMVGSSPEAVTEPLYTFEDLCKLDATKLVSPFSASFHVSPNYLAASQLTLHLSKQQLSLGRSDKLSYAAVTVGQAGTSMVLTNMSAVPASGYVTSVPVLSPAAQQSQHFGRVFQTPLPGLAGVNGVLPNHMIYSLVGSGDPQTKPMSRGQAQMRTSPQPGGYPTKQSRTAVPLKSPLVMGRRFHNPPMSPMSQFLSPPPGLGSKVSAQQKSNNISEDNLGVRPTHRRQKVR